MAMKPAADGDEIARWFWAETAAGQLLRRVRQRLDASDDPAWKAAAFGVARGQASRRPPGSPGRAFAQLMRPTRRCPTRTPLPLRGALRG